MIVNRTLLAATLFLVILASPAMASPAMAGPALAKPEPAIPDRYAGLGARILFNDPTALVLDVKVRLAASGKASLSTRPALMAGADGIEARLPLTLDIPVSARAHLYGGAGLAYNASGSGQVKPMITAGMDLGVSHAFFVDLNVNVIFESGTDTELIITLNRKL